MQSRLLTLVLIPLAVAKNEQLSSSSLSSPSEQGVKQCSLYVAKSSNGGWGIFTGIDLPEGTLIGSPEPIIPLIDMNQPERDHWQKEYTWKGPLSRHMGLESNYSVSALVPGVGSLITCDADWANVVASTELGFGPKRSSASAGAYAYDETFSVRTSQIVYAGEELFLNCDDDEPGGIDDPPSRMSVLLLEETGSCIDGLRVDETVAEHTGKGAFATRRFEKGSVATTSPVLPIDRHDLKITEPKNQELKVIWKRGEAEPSATDALGKRRKQLLYNYCFGSKDSGMLLLPVGSHVTRINHDSQEANVAIRWAKKDTDGELFNMAPKELRLGEVALAIEYVATRKILPYEEILLDYGEEWEAAWKEHEKKLQERHNVQFCNSGSCDVASLYEGGIIRTEAEQVQDPYPDNVMTICAFTFHSSRWSRLRGKFQAPLKSVWNESENDGCLRPCTVVQRDGEYYEAIMEDVPIYSEQCELGPHVHKVQRIPRGRIGLAYRPYMSDHHQPWAFRHTLGTPKDFFPQGWIEASQTKTATSFKRNELQATQLNHVVWKDSNALVSEFSYEIGLDPSIRQKLLSYANEIGVTDIFRRLLIEGDPLRPGTDKYAVLGGQNWYIDRPKKHWHSDMHWVSPRDETAHDSFLRTLGGAGFDRYLVAIGKSFGLDSLVVYHLTFIGVSHCEGGYMHHDFSDVDGKAFNMIIPLILANESVPELSIQQDDDEDRVGLYKYRYDVGSIIGDGAYHATASCDYRDQNEMRMAATVYMADVNIHNLDAILDSFTQEYPPDDPLHLYNLRGSHWKRKDRSKRLPTPIEANDEVGELPQGRLVPITWEGGKRVASNLFHVGVPTSLRQTVLEKARDLEIEQSMSATLFRGEGFDVGRNEVLVAHDGSRWEVQRHFENSDLHTISPADAEAFGGLLSHLLEIGFLEVLQGIGEAFNLQKLSIYELSFLAVHQCTGTLELPKRNNPLGDNLYEVVIPLLLADDAAPEILFSSFDHSHDFRGHFKNSVDRAYLFGHGVVRGIAPHDYSVQRQMRMELSIKVGEITEDNLDSIISTMDFSYPPQDLHFVWDELAPGHWKRDLTN